jgi:pimeloyl-ACP methyl ester carboxylesterase
LRLDLWGRGYSDSPLGVRHDIRLFSTQIILALLSSPLSWFGATFSIVAFSLGGPISLEFTSAFPETVRSLVLLGPAGLLRTLPQGYENPILHKPDLASDQEIREAVRLVLGVEPSPPPCDDLRRETGLHGGPTRVDQAFNMAALLQWQFDYHKGHVYSFQDTVRYGPLQHQESVWSKVCDIFSGRARPDSPLYGKKLLVFFGEDDDVVVATETVEDILRFLPSDHLQVQYLPGGHGFPYPNSESITRSILSFWNSSFPSVL